jgi:UDP-glucose 4-epimerase
MSEQHVVVTGGIGFVARAVVRGLVECGHHVTVVDRDPRDVELGERVSLVTGDLRDAAVRDQVVVEGVTGIIHLAAYTSVLGSMGDPLNTFNENVVVTAELLDLCRARGVPRFILSSTNAVVGEMGGRTITEESTLHPLTAYGATKAACEMLLSGYANSYGMGTCALRFTNIYGPGMEFKDSFIARIMKAARAGTTLQIYGDGLQRRDLVHVDDVAASVVRAWQDEWTGTVVIGSGESVTVLEMLERARKATGLPLPAEHVPAREGEMPAVVVDIGHARSLGYVPSVDLDAGLASAWADAQTWP